MELNRRVPALLLLSLLAPGCYQSSTAGTMEPDSDASPATDAANTADASPATDTGSSPDAAVRPCMPSASDPSPRALFSLADGPSIVTVDSRGEAHTLYTFGAAENVGSDSVVVTDVQSRGGFIAANAYVSVSQSGANPEDSVLIDPTGRVVWHGYVARDANPQLYLSDNGWLTIDTWDGNGLAISPDGTMHRLTGISPVAAAAPWGEIPVRRGSPYTSADLGWLDLGTGTFRPLTHAFDPAAVESHSMPIWLGNQMVYPTVDANAHELVIEGASGSLHVATLPRETDRSWPQVFGTDGARYLLLGGGTPELWRMDATTGEITGIRVDGPGDGRTLVGASPLGAQVLVDGSVLAPFGTDTETALFRTTDLGAHWTALGDSVPLMQPSYGRSMSAEWAGGTFVVSTLDSLGYVFVLRPLQILGVGELPAPTVDAAYRNFVQVRRPTSLSPDGRCLAYWTGSANFGSTGTLHVTDFHGNTVDVLTSMDYRDAPTWLP